VRDPDAQPFLPACPLRAAGAGVGNRCWLRQGGQEGVHFTFEPGVQDRVGAARDAFDPHLTGRWAEQRQECRRPQAQVLVRLLPWMRLRLPTSSGLGHRLVGAGFILARQREPARLGFAVRLRGSAPFRVGVGVVDQHPPAFAPAHRCASLAPRPRVLPAPAGIV
jgi:hypothetical protein